MASDIRLGVNVDHIATLRQARGTPWVLWARDWDGFDALTPVEETLRALDDLTFVLADQDVTGAPPPWVGAGALG